MRVVMLVTNACQPDPRVEKEADALGAAGHRVTILAWDREGHAPEKEARGTFDIERIGPRAPYGGGVGSLGLFRAFWRAAARRAVELDADVVHAHDTDTIVAALRAVHEMRGHGGQAGLVIDFHELYRASRMVPQPGVLGIVSRWVVDRIEHRGVRRANLVLVANPGTLPHYERIAGSIHVLLVPNAPDPDVFRPLECPGGVSPDELRVVFVGRKRYARTLEALAEAVRTTPGVRCHLAGGGPDAARVDALAERSERVTTEGPVPYGEIPVRYACADVVYAAYDPGVGNVRYTIPGKVLEAMACAKPVIVAEGTWAAGYVTQNGIGVAVDATDPARLAAALEQLRDDPEARRTMGERGRRVVEEGMNWRDTAASLVGAYDRLGRRLGLTPE